MDGQIDGWTEGQTDGWTEGQTEAGVYTKQENELIFPVM